MNLHFAKLFSHSTVLYSFLHFDMRASVCVFMGTLALFRLSFNLPFFHLLYRISLCAVFFFFLTLLSSKSAPSCLIKFCVFCLLSPRSFYDARAYLKGTKFLVYILLTSQTPFTILNFVIILSTGLVGK